MFTGKGVSLAYSATNLQYKYKISLKIQPMQTTFLGGRGREQFWGKGSCFRNYAYFKQYLLYFGGGKPRIKDLPLVVVCARPANISIQSWHLTRQVSKCIPTVTFWLLCRSNFDEITIKLVGLRFGPPCIFILHTSHTKHLTCLSTHHAVKLVTNS